MADLPTRPERPPLPTPGEKPRHSNWITVLLAFMLAIGGLVSLMVMPLVGYAPVIILAVFGFVALHYFTWGWWLTNLVRKEQDNDDHPK